MLNHLEKLMSQDEIERIGVQSMTETQQQALLEWALRMYKLGQHIVEDIDEIKYSGRLIILDDGTRWEVDELDADTADMWSSTDKVLVIDDEMYNLDQLEKISVEQVDN